MGTVGVGDTEFLVVQDVDDGVVVLNAVSNRLKPHVEAVALGIIDIMIMVLQGVSLIRPDLVSRAVLKEVEKPILKPRVGIVGDGAVGFGDDVVEIIGVPAFVGAQKPHFSGDGADVDLVLGNQNLPAYFPIGTDHGDRGVAIVVHTAVPACGYGHNAIVATTRSGTHRQPALCVVNLHRPIAVCRHLEWLGAPGKTKCNETLRDLKALFLAAGGKSDQGHT